MYVTALRHTGEQMRDVILTRLKLNMRLYIWGGGECWLVTEGRWSFLGTLVYSSSKTSRTI